MQHGFREVLGGDLPFRAGHSVAAKLGLDTAGHNRADPDVVVPQVLHDSFGETDQAEFGRIVGGPAWEGILARQAADVDDEPASALFHQGDRLTRTVEGATQIRVDDLPPLRRVHLGYRRKSPDAGIVDKEVESAERLLDEGKETLDLLQTADVAGAPDDLALRRHVFYRPLNVPLLPAADCCGRAGVEQSFRDCAPDTPGCTCNDGDFPFKILSHSIPLFRFPNSVTTRVGRASPRPQFDCTTQNATLAIRLSLSFGENSGRMTLATISSPLARKRIPDRGKGSPGGSGGDRIKSKRPALLLERHIDKHVILAVLLLLVLLPVTAVRVSAALIPDELQRLAHEYLDSGDKVDRDRLLAYLRKSSSPDTKGLARFALGMGDHEAENYAQAAEELEKATGEMAELADYARYYQARSLAAAEKFREAAGLLASFENSFAESRLVPGAGRLQAESLIRSEQRDQARKLLETEKSPISTAVRLWLLGRIEELDGQPLKAVRTYRQAYYKYPFSPQAEEAEARLDALRRKLGKRYPAAPSTWRLKRADALFRASKYPQAWAEYRRSLPGLEASDRDRAQVRIGASDYRRLHTSAAYSRLSRLRVEDPTADAERLYYLGECARRLGRRKEFAQRAEELGKRYPGSPWYEEALFSLGNYYLLKDEHPTSRGYYERTARAFPDGKRGPLAHWKVCWRAYLDRDPAAKSLLEEHVRLYARSPRVAGAAYWLARIIEKGGNPPLARVIYSQLASRYPHYYYAQQARRRLAALGKAEDSEKPAGPSYLASVPAPRRLVKERSAQTERRLRRGRLLYELSLPDLAESELLTADYRAADSHWVGLELARQTQERGEFHRGLRYMKRYGFGYLRFPFDSMPREFWESLFPLRWEKQLRARVRPHGLDPYLVAGIIRQESEFNPQARSRAGARGLMQIMPATGRRLARRLGVSGYSTRSLNSPDLSLRLGTRYLRDLFDQFENRTVPALAAYNAGEHRVEAWLASNGYDDPTEFVELIPFTETRGYVQAVIRNTAIYRQLYGKSGLKADNAPSGLAKLSRER